jgi:hypothetical protein
MKRIIGVFAALCLAGGFAVAQEAKPKTHTESVTKHSGPGPDWKVKMESVSGTVKEYEAGKKIKIVGPKDEDFTFDLDENAKIEGTIVVGQPAHVSYTKGGDGVKRVAVVSTASKAAQAAAGMPKSHTEQTVEHKAPAMDDTKMKTETVIGVVKEFEAGKKLVVTGPKDKEYRFDLDENVSMSTPVAIGDRVKVTYRKTEGGEKVTVVARENG